MRKEANFGCAKCGIPIVTIHHVEGYEGDHHLPELIMLCKEHHGQADQGLISKDELYLLKAHPFNETSVNHRLQISSAEELVVHIGGNTFIDTQIPLQLHGEPIIFVRREGADVLFSVKLEGRDGSERMRKIDSVWQADTTNVDVRHSENKDETEAWLSLKLNESDPYFNAKVVNGELYLSGNFYLKGNVLEIRENGSFVLNKLATFVGMTMKHLRIGIQL